MKNIFINAVKYIPRKIKMRLVGNEIYEIRERLRCMEIDIKAILKMQCGLNFRGQVWQDGIAYLYFNGKKDGFYIDIGANDGVAINNTLVFEQLGWKGICVEPVPEIFNELKKNRTCDCYNVAIANKSGESVEFIKAEGVEVLSGLTSEMAQAHKNRILRENGKIRKIYVKTLSFADLMADYKGLKHIDFMSIDVEGAEMSILKAINFKEYSFGLITVENNEEVKGGGNRLKKYMKEQGYKVYADLGLDIMFIPDN
ncbi:MAG: FkbM family methyltransferase [Spirochaetaceae bacterium]|nr:FkbM family methyltransferase [Spirochaetaceae bacterium]